MRKNTKIHGKIMMTRTENTKGKIMDREAEHNETQDRQKHTQRQ